jgi:hypothetical protein
VGTVTELEEATVFVEFLWKLDRHVRNTIPAP